MAAKKEEVTTIDFSNSIEKIKESAKTVNSEVVDTTIEVLEDLRTNGARIRTVATTKVKEAIDNLTIDNSMKFVKNTAKNIHNYNIETAEEVIDLAMKGGKEWQLFLAKSLKNGVHFFGQQQDITLTTLEDLKKQYSLGKFKFSNIFNFDFNMDLSKEDITLDPLTLEPATKTVKKATKKVSTKAKTTTKKAKAKVVKVTKKVAKPATKKTTKVSVKKATAKKAKVAAKKTTTKKVMVTKNNLRLIEGIGPKIEELLNRGGIQTFQQLADASKGTLKGILAAGGARYKMHDPTTWSQQAVLAAAGKKAELAKLQGELKGGRAKK